jgi:hypothetical protein
MLITAGSCADSRALTDLMLQAGGVALCRHGQPGPAA